MRAPRNTNQFLMGEKYRLMHLRSDSVGTEPGGGGGGSSSPECGDESAGGVEPGCLDMEAYLEALENARGALLLGGAPPPAPPSSGLPLEENSLPYFPSEDDLLQSQRFMERDFQQFCSTIA